MTNDHAAIPRPILTDPAILKRMNIKASFHLHCEGHLDKTST
jgi:hypothetical protein